MADLRRLGIELRVEAGALRFRAPKGALTPELRAQAQARSAELLALLEEPAIPSAAIRPVDRSRPLRMSFAQERMWFLHRLEGPSSTYNITPVFRLRGPLSLAALRESFRLLARRHETLRMRFSEIDGEGIQIVDPPGEVPIDSRSLEHLPPDERLAAAERIVLAETARPFDLEAGPTLRVTLIELAPDDHILLPFMHHLIADGWSLGILQREFRLLYEGLAAGRAVSLDPLPLQYPDFAAWQRAIQQGERGRLGIAWWRAQLAGAPQVLELPLDFERPSAVTFNGGVLHVTIPEATVQALAATGRSAGCTLFMILLAAYGVLLNRLTGRQDLLVGSPVASRPLRELEGIIGCFVNTVVLRLRPRGGERFIDFLQQVRTTTLEAYAWQDIPVEAVIDAVIARRDPSRIPLYQTQFSLQNVPVAPGEMRSLAIEHLPMERVAAKNDLSFILHHVGGEGIHAELEYNTDLFRAESVARLGEEYIRLLERIVAAPETTIADLSPPAARPARRDPPLEPELPEVAESPDLVSGFEASVARYPEVPAVRDARHELTYGELNRRAEALAGALLARGTAPESPVGVFAGRSVALVVAILAILKSGGAYVPLSPDHPAERLRFMMAQAGLRALVTDAEHAAAARELIAGTAIELLVAGEVPANGAAPPAVRPPIAPGQLAYIIFTSGSTGRPKGVMIEHRSVVNLVRGLRDLVYRDLEAQRPARIALVASAVFDASVQQLFPALLYGHTLCIAGDEVVRDGAGLCELLRDWRIEVSDCTPSLLGLMVRGGLAARCAGTLRHLLVGGEALPADLVRTLHATPGGRTIGVTNLYGPTECCVDVVALTVDDAFASETAQIPIGRPMRNCLASIVDDEGRPVAAGAPGELWIGGLCLARGYVNDPELTQERFRALPAAGMARAYRTGDRCRATAGGIIEFLGRDDDQVKVLGHRIEPGEVEFHLRAHPSVGAVSVQARLTSRGYRELVAYVVATEPLSVASLREFAAARLPAYMIPAYFVPLDSLPLNASGKVARELLPDPETAPAFPSGVAFEAPSTPAERALLGVWKQTLKLGQAGVRDNYFASGGDSIKALQLAARLRDAGWELHLRDLFLYPTIAELAPHLRPRASGEAAATAPETGVAPLSSVGRFFFATYGPSAQFNQALLLRLRRPLTVELLRAACDALARHHGMLRARFVRRDGEWVQEILPADAVRASVESVDLRDRAGSSEELQRHAATVQARFSIDRAPLWSVVLYDLPDGQRLLLSAHHLIIDGVSWRIFVDDLESALDQLVQNRPPVLAPGSASYAAWAESQRAVAAGGLAAERAYWPLAEGVRDDRRASAEDRYGDRRDVRVILTRELTRVLLTGAHAAYATQINDLLLAAVVCAWKAWSGDRRCAMTIEGHGREPLEADLDLTRTIGWFTSFYPFAIELPAGVETGGAIKLVKEALRAVPNRGAGYGILRYGTPDGDRLPPLPPLAFNYLGQFDRDPDGWFERAPEPGPATAGGDVRLPWPLEITAAVVDGRMELTLAYSARRYEERAAASLLGLVHDELEAIARHTSGRGATEHTASDFDYAGFDQESLESFLRTL